MPSEKKCSSGSILVNMVEDWKKLLDKHEINIHMSLFPSLKMNITKISQYSAKIKIVKHGALH